MRNAIEGNQLKQLLNRIQKVVLSRSLNIARSFKTLLRCRMDLDFYVVSENDFKVQNVFFRF